MGLAISKNELIERSKSIVGNKKFWGEPPTIDIYDKREIFLDMAVNGCNLFVCKNKYCCNNIGNKIYFLYLIFLYNLKKKNF